MKQSAYAFGSWLKAQRKLSGKTQDEVAAIAGLHKVTISKIENGQDVSEETAVALAEAVGAPREEAVLRSLKVRLASMEPANEVDRRLQRLANRVPASQLDRWIKAVEAVTDMIAA